MAYTNYGLVPYMAELYDQFPWSYFAVAVVPKAFCDALPDPNKFSFDNLKVRCLDRILSCRCPELTWSSYGQHALHHSEGRSTTRFSADRDIVDAVISLLMQ